MHGILLFPMCTTHRSTHVYTQSVERWYLQAWNVRIASLGEYDGPCTKGERTILDEGTGKSRTGATVSVFAKNEIIALYPQVFNNTC